MCPSFTVMKRTYAQYTHTLYYVRVCSKTMHSLLCITSKKLPHTTLCYITSRFILPWNFRVRPYYAAASQPRVFVRLLVGNHTSRSTTARKLGGWLYLYQNKYKLCCSKWIYLPTFFGVKRSSELIHSLPAWVLGGISPFQRDNGFSSNFIFWSTRYNIFPK